MKFFKILALIAFVAWVTSPTFLNLKAQSAQAEPLAEEAAPKSSAKTNRHLRLCAMLGLKVGKTYVFMLNGNDQVHYWTIRSLGADGWILAKDFNFPATWVNLSEVIAVSPIESRPKEGPERQKKANRER